MPKFGTTKRLFFDQKCLIGVLLGMNFLKKTIVIFEISTLNLSICKIS